MSLTKLTIIRKNINKLTAEDIQDINYVLEKSEYATIFHTVEWHKIISTVEGRRCYFLIAKKGDEPVGIFPFYSTPQWGLFNIKTSSTLETRYGGPISVGNELEIIRSLIKNYESGMRTLIWYIHTPPGWNASILKDMGYDLATRKETILDLDKEEKKIWMELESRTRRAVRKALKSHVTIKKGDGGDIDEYYKMVQATYSRSHTPPPPKRLIKMAYEKLYPKNMIRLIFAEYEGEYIAGLLPTMYGDTVYYWGGADAGTNRSVQPMSLLFWEIIIWAKKNGYKYYDMLGIDTPRLAKFKLSWGGEIIEHYYCTKKSSLFLNLKRAKDVVNR